MSSLTEVAASWGRGNADGEAWDGSVAAQSRESDAAVGNAGLEDGYLG